MKYGRLALSAVAATLTFYVYGFLVNGMLIARSYAPYTMVYRQPDTIMRYMPLGLIGTLLTMLALALIFAKGYEGGDAVKEGLRFGVLIGVFATCVHVVDNYVTLNIGHRHALYLAIAAFVQWIIVCMVIALVFKPAPKSAH
jgi:hypothetical protein